MFWHCRPFLVHFARFSSPQSARWRLDGSSPLPFARPVPRESRRVQRNRQRRTKETRDPSPTPRLPVPCMEGCEGTAGVLPRPPSLHSPQRLRLSPPLLLPLPPLPELPLRHLNSGVVFVIHQRHQPSHIRNDEAVQHCLSAPFVGK